MTGGRGESGLEDDLGAPGCGQMEAGVTPGGKELELWGAFIRDAA